MYVMFFQREMPYASFVGRTRLKAIAKWSSSG